MVNHDRGVSRRAFLGSTLSYLALAVGVTDEGDLVARLIADEAPPEFSPNPWIRIDRHGAVTLRAHKSEMGQGVRTALPAIVAAELGADWARVTVRHAEPGPEFREMGTSGSGSVSGSWLPLRRAAAAARSMLIQAAALKWRVDAGGCGTERGYVVHRGSGRRASFAALLRAAAQLPVPQNPTLRSPTALALLGTRLRRVDGPGIVRGSAVYGIDVRVPQMHFAVIARPPVPGATPQRWNEAAALQVPRVEQVVSIPSGFAVVARDTWSAIRGRAALAVEWNEPDLAAEHSTAFLDRLESALGSGKLARREGDPSAILAGTVQRLQAVYRFPFQAHAALEPLSAVADVRADRCEVWAGTQRPNQVQDLAMELLGLPREAVNVHVALMGGAFGRRIAIDHVREAILLSKAIGRPVQVVWTREDDFAHDMFQAAQVNRLTAGLDSQRRIVAWRHEVADYHLSMFGPRNPNADPAADGDPWGGFDSPYRFPAFECTLAVLDAPVPTGAWRSVTYPVAVFARECFLDEVAHAVGRDPLEFRLDLIASPGNIETRAGPRPNGDRLRRVLQLAARGAGWGEPFRTAMPGRRMGRGIACNPYHQGTMVAQVADVSVGAEGDIQVHRVVTAIDVGRVIDRSGLEAQVEGGVTWALSAALKTEISFVKGRAEQRNFDRFPVLRLREAPLQEVFIVESELGPFGAGEPPVPAVYAAVGNAVFQATGERLRATPLRLPRRG